MEFGSTEQMQMVYETLVNIDIAITRLQERTVQIHTVDDFHFKKSLFDKVSEN